MNVYIGGTKDYSAMRGPCDEGFHIAMRTEGNKIKDILTVLLGTAPVGTDLNTYLLLPSAGYITYNSATREGVGEYARSWTVNWYILSSSITYINGITIGSSGQSQEMSNDRYNRRGTGYPIRPIKDTEAVPDNSWTTLLDGSGTAPGAGVFHNSTLGLISLSSDGEDWITIADKNLGATSTDISSTDSYGYYYQWGNNYGFTYGSITSSSTRVDASGYGPGNYYSSSNFIITSDNNDWSTVRNDNLRGGVTGIVSPAALKNAYIGEVYEYSYDFRNKSIATCQSDGWSFSNTSTVTINSDGMNCGTASASVYCIPSGLNASLSTANKINMEMMFYKGSKSGSNGTNAVFYISGPSSMSSNGTGGTSGYDGSSNYVIGGRVLGTVVYSGNYNSTPNGTYTLTTVIDLANKTINTKYGTIANLSGSLTDAQISTIRTLKYLRIYSDTTAVIKTINVAVE